jgi:hypothetical protein
MRSRTSSPSSAGLRHLPEPVVATIHAERARVESDLGHVICGRYLGNRDGHPNVCWQSRGHAGSHL